MSKACPDPSAKLQPGNLAAIAGVPVLGLLAALVISPFVFKAAWINNNVAQLLSTGLKLSAGAKLYIDWIDTNTPAGYLVGQASTLVAGLMRLPPVIPYYALLFSCLGWGGHLILENSATLEKTYGPSAKIALLCGYFAAFLGVSFRGFEDFGERELWFLVFLLPYLVQRWVGTGGLKKHPVWVFLTAVTASMKPGFLLMLAVAEVIRFLQTRKLQRGLWLPLILGSAAQFLVLASYAPASALAYFTKVLPSYRYYDGLNEPLGTLISMPLKFYSLGMLPLTLWILRILRKKNRTVESADFASLTFPLSLAALAWVAIQHKFWAYHFIPFYGVVVFFIFAETGFHLSRAQVGPRFLNFILILPLFFLGGRDIAHASHESSLGRLTSRFLPVLEGTDKAMLLTDDIASVASAYYSRIPFVGPWVMLHTFAGMGLTKDPSLRARALRNFRDEILGRARETNPAMILIDQSYANRGRPLAKALEDDVKLLSRFESLGYSAVTEDEVDECLPGPGSFRLYLRNDTFQKLKSLCPAFARQAR